MNVAAWSTSSTMTGANLTVTWQFPTTPPDDAGTAGVREPRRPLPDGPPPVQVDLSICKPSAFRG